MPIENSESVRFIPRGVCDTLDGVNSTPGAMALLQNLMFDPSTPDVFTCRPANTVKYSFTDFTSPGVISAGLQIGNLTYGMVATSRNSGHDEPFVYDHNAGTFISVGGTISSATTPTTQATSGDWITPTMAMVGTKIIVTHPGFPGGAGVFFGWFETSTGSPVWNAGNTTGAVQLSSVPQCVAQYNNRAWFGVKNAVVFTDTLSLNITNAGLVQVLTLGDSTNVNALAGLPLSTTQQGIIQGLIAFKTYSTYQITGDSATSNLASPAMNLAVGCNSPRSIVAVPTGLMFAAVDGVRTITFDGAMSEPNLDLRVPFINALVTTRTSAAFNANVYRICVKNGIKTGTPYEEYWFDFIAGQWTGPHTFRQDLALAFNNAFILFTNALPAKLWDSYVLQNVNGLGGSFTENGTALAWVYQTSPMPDLGIVESTALGESTVTMALAGTGNTYTLTAQGEGSGVLAQATITAPTASPIWGSFTWGAALWGAVQYGLKPIIIPWNKPFAFNKLVVQIAGPSSLGFKIGSLQLMPQQLGYISQ